MNRWLPSVCAIVMMSVAAVSALAQTPIRGIELYQRMSRNLAPFTGLRAVTWLPDGAAYVAKERVDGRTTFYRVDAESGDKTPLFAPETVDRVIAAYNRIASASVTHLPFTDFTVERDGDEIVFEEKEHAYVYSIPEDSMTRHARPEWQPAPPWELILEPVLSPNRHYYIYVENYDLYLFDTLTKEKKRLTTDGSRDLVPGFLSSGPAYVWSPDSTRIAYLRSDISSQFRVPIQMHEDVQESMQDTSYPFVGSPTPTIRIYVLDVSTGESREVANNIEDKSYLRNLAWRNDGSELLYQRVNRLQNRLEFTAIHTRTSESRTILVEEEPTFLNEYEFLHPLESQDEFIWASERDGWRHLYLYEYSGKLIRQVTSGDFEVDEIVLVDQATRRLFVTCYTDFGMERHLYRASLDGGPMQRVTADAGFHTVSMDATGALFTDEYSSLTTPRTVELRRADGALVRNLGKSNAGQVEELGLRAPELVTVKASDGQTDLYGHLYTPADFDPSKNYPLLVYVYGGAHSKEVFNTFQTAGYWARFAQLGFCLWMMDARGTPYRGKAFQSAAYLKQGLTDVDDQAAGVRQITARPYIDETRVGVMGLSHGGIMTLLALLKHPDLYHVGVAGAPLTKLEWGPAQYIEKTMRTPELNPDGFFQASAMNFAEKLEGNLLIYCGTGDRNVSITNTMAFVGKLIDLGKEVDMMIYPGGEHVFDGKDVQYQLNQQMAYFLRHLKPEGWEQNAETLWAK